MAHKNFRTIASTVFPIGVTKNVTNFDRLSLISPSILVGIVPNLMERWVLGSATSVRNFVKIDAREDCLRARLFCMVWCEEEEEEE